MGVTVINKPYDYAKAGLFNSAFNILGDQIGRMSDRAHEAAQTEKWRKGMKHVAEAGTPVQGAPYPEMVTDAGQGYFGDALSDTYAGGEQANNFGRELWASTPGLGKSKGGTRHDVAKALGEYGSPQLFKDSMEYYKDIFANQEKEDYANRISDTYNARGGYDRNNQSRTMGNMIFADLAGANTANYIGNIAPNMQGQIVNTGDKQVPVTYDPFTGGYTQGTSMEMGVDPTNKYVSDNNLEGTKISARASMANTGAQPQFSMVQGEDGQIYSFDQRTGGIYQNGQPVQDVRGARQGIGLTEQQKVEEAVGSIIQISATEEEFGRRLDAFKTQYPQYAQLIDQFAGSPQIWGPKGLFNEPKPAANPYYQNPAVNQYREKFPQKARQMTDVQILRELERLSKLPN